jgi:hypothetical protein
MLCNIILYHCKKIDSDDNSNIYSDNHVHVPVFVCVLHTGTGSIFFGMGSSAVAYFARLGRTPR